MNRGILEQVRKKGLKALLSPTLQGSEVLFPPHLYPQRGEKVVIVHDGVNEAIHKDTPPCP